MLVNLNEQKHISLLFRFLLQGEQLARETSRRQAQMTQDNGIQYFLRRQSRQELFHSRMFQIALSVINARGRGCNISISAMQKYDSLLNEAAKQNNQAELLLGMQVILEGFGDTVLENLESSVANRSNYLQHLRQLILSQEDEHHRFGIHRLNAMVAEKPLLQHQLKLRSNDYLELIEQFVNDCSGLLNHFHLDMENYFESFNNRMPLWLRF